MMAMIEFGSISAANHRFPGRCRPVFFRIALCSGDSAHSGRQKALIPAFWKYTSRFKL